MRPILNIVFQLDARTLSLFLQSFYVLTPPTVRMDLVKLMTRDKLALVPDEDIIALMLDKLTKNYHQGKLPRVRFSEVSYKLNQLCAPR